MRKEEFKPIRSARMFDFLLGWIMGKLLDFLIKKAISRLDLKGGTHIRRYIFVMFAVDVLMITVRLLEYIPDEPHVSEYREQLVRFLRLHRRYHEFVGTEICCVCVNISYLKPHFQKYVSELDLYPPFSFAKRMPSHKKS